jgi:hypothetical protein
MRLANIGTPESPFPVHGNCTSRFHSLGLYRWIARISLSRRAGVSSGYLNSVQLVDRALADDGLGFGGENCKIKS